MPGADHPLEVAPWQETCTGDLKPTSLVLEKFSGNDKFGTGSLVPRQRSSAFDRGRGRLHKLVRAHGPGGRAARERSPFGSNPVPQELDSGALCRACAVLLAG